MDTRTRVIALAVCDIDCVKAFLHILPKGITDKYGIMFFVDDRKFNIVDECFRLVGKSGHEIDVIRGADVVDQFCELMNLPEWLYTWKRTVKIFIPFYLQTYYKHFKQMLFMDDDQVLLRDPAELFDMNFCGAKDCFLGKRQSGDVIEYFWKFFNVSKEDFNASPMNGGTYVYTLSKKAMDWYSYCVKEGLGSKEFEAIFNKGKIFGDQQFLDLTFKKMGSVQIAPRLVQALVCKPLSFRHKLTKYPITMHYAVTDERLAEYIDYFLSLKRINDEDGGPLISEYKTREEFYQRTKRTKVKFRKRFTMEEAKSLSIAVRITNGSHLKLKRNARRA